MTQNGPLGVSFALHVSYTLYIARIVLYRRKKNENNHDYSHCAMLYTDASVKEKK